MSVVGGGSFSGSIPSAAIIYEGKLKAKVGANRGDNKIQNRQGASDCNAIQECIGMFRKVAGDPLTFEEEEILNSLGLKFGLKF